MKKLRRNDQPRKEAHTAAWRRDGHREHGRAPRTVAALTPAEQAYPEGPALRFPSRLVADKILMSADGPSGERKLATILFGDLVRTTGSTLLAPEDNLRFAEDFFLALLKLAETYGGVLAEVSSNGFTVVFGGSVAHEDHAARACHSALAIRAAAEDLDKRRKGDGRSGFTVRVGVCTQQVLVQSIATPDEVDLQDLDLEDAWRPPIEKHLQPGAIVVADNSYRLVKNLFDFQELRRFSSDKRFEALYELKGRSQFETQLQALTVKGLTRFVGRQKELETLKAAVEKARAGSGQAVRIFGDAGVGKSRLILELRKSLHGTDFLFLEGRCSPYGVATSYLPFVEVLTTYFGIVPGESDAAAKRRIRDRVAGMRIDRKVLPALCEVLSLPVEDSDYAALGPPLKQERIFEAVIGVLVGEGHRRLTIVVVEDLHWIDPTSDRLLAHLVGSVRDRRLLLILAHRPEYSPHEDFSEFLMDMRLDDLSRVEAVKLIRSLLRGCRVDAAVQDFIVDRAGGSPLFIEEITRSLVDSGAIDLEEKSYVFCTDPAGLATPATVQSVIAARMDRLEGRTKQTIQAAAVIGREFGTKLLGWVLGSPETLEEDLDVLLQREFIIQIGYHPKPTFAFKHALVRDVAYNSLVYRRRWDLHERTAHAIKALYHGDAATWYEVLGHHYAAARRWPDAYKYWKLSGGKARERYSLKEAFHLYDRALAALKKMPPTVGNKEKQLELLLLINWTTKFLDYPEKTHRLLVVGERLARELGRPTVSAGFHASLSVYYRTTGSPDKADRHARKCLKTFAAVDPSSLERHELEIVASLCLAFCMEALVAGRFEEVLSQGLRVAGVLEQVGVQDDSFGMPVVPCSCMLALACQSCGWIGDYPQGAALYERAIRIARAADNIYSIGWAELCYGYILAMKGKWPESVEHLQEAHRCFAEGRFGQSFDYSAHGMLGYAYYLGDQYDLSREHLKESIVVGKETGVSLYMALALAYLALASNDAGDFDEAHHCVEEAIEVAGRCHELHNLGIARIVRGRVLGKSGSLRWGEAEAMFLMGIDMLAKRKLKPHYAVGYLYLGEFYANTDRGSMASRVLRKALALFREMDMDYWAAKAQAQLSRL